MTYVFREKPELEDIEHFGVKGMRWGVRRQRRLDTLRNISEGGGTFRQKARAALTTTNIDFAKGRGIRGAAARKVQRIEAREQRRLRGEATAVDVLIRIGSTRLSDLIPTRET